jgi:DNA-binding LytR/AlgR family response regulator
MRCIILEDEIPAQNILKNFLAKVPDMQIVGVFQTAKAASLFFQDNTADVIFLDINLPDISGIDFIKTIIKPPKIIITTAYPDYALDSFELATIVDYLVKPFSFDRFLKAVLKIKNQVKYIEKDDNTIFLNVDKTLHKVILEDILYIESDRNYITFFTEKKKFSIIDSLKMWKDKLDQDSFLQIHKSYLINLKKIEKISGNEVFILNKRLPIGRVYKKDLLNKIS